MPMTDEERARRSAETMWENDHASQGMGMKILEITPGRAVLSMKVKQQHVNGHAICHGGFIFTLADSAFAFACNSYNKVTLAQQCTINFLAPGRLGDELTASAREVHRQGRSGIYDITVTNQDSVTIAEFRGLSRTISGQTFPEEIVDP